MATVTWAVPGTYWWLCPPGVTSVAGGAWGGGAGTAGFALGGAGAGGYGGEPDVTVTPGQLYLVIVGAPGYGAGIGGTPGPGGDSSFTGDLLTVLGYGGQIASGTTGGQGGPASGNTAAYPGGSGGQGFTGGGGGGGGSSAGPSSAGNNGGNATSGSGGLAGAAVTGGGPGGVGGGGSTPGGETPFSGPGGGAGAGGQGTLHQGGGAAGWAGQVQITYTAPLQPQTPDFITGYQPQPSDFNNWIQAPFSWLTGKVVFRAELSAATTWVAATNTIIPFDVIDEDPFAGWNATTHSWTPPAEGTGTYEVSITASAAAASDATTALRCVLYLNGSAYYTMSATQASQSQDCITGGSAPLQLYGGQDAVSAYAYWNTGGSNGSAVTTAGQRCTVEITWLSL
jgi:hypothetical protein